MRTSRPIDTEGRRAHEALELVRQMRRERGASGEWRQLARHRRRRRVVRVVAWSTLVVVLAGAGVGLVAGSRAGFGWLRENTGLLSVQRVVVSGNDRLRETRVLEALNVGSSDDILNVDLEQLARRIMALPEVQSADVSRNWKRELHVAVVERQPRALVLLDRLYEVDDEGVLLPGDDRGRVSDLTIIRGIHLAPPEPGEQLTAPGLMPALSLVQSLSLPEIGLENAVSEVWAGQADSLVMIMLADGVPVRVGRGEIPPRRLMAFRAVIEDLRRREVDPEYLDLRFSGQVVVKPRGRRSADGHNT